MTARKLSDAEVAAFVQAVIHEYVASVNWFYADQIKPYLPTLAAHVLQRMKEKQVHLTTDK